MQERPKNFEATARNILARKKDREWSTMFTARKVQWKWNLCWPHKHASHHSLWRANTKSPLASLCLNLASSCCFSWQTRLKVNADGRSQRQQTLRKDLKGCYKVPEIAFFLLKCKTKTPAMGILEILSAVNVPSSFRFSLLLLDLTVFGLPY